MSSKLAVLFKNKSNASSHKPQDKKPLKVSAISSEVAEILLYGEIGESWWDDTAVSAKQFKDAVKELSSKVTEIHLRVNSPGGSVFDGMTIYETIRSERNNGRKVIAYVDGYAASIASIIIQACDEIIIGDGGMVMIHKPLVGVWGNANELERYINILDKIEENMITIYQKKTGMSRIEISEALEKETWYTSEEAIEVGLADKKFDFQDTIQLVASINDCPWFKNKPQVQNKNDLVRDRLREITNKNKKLLAEMKSTKF